MALSTDEIRENYIDSDTILDIDAQRQYSEFDEWLAEVKAGAWDEGAQWAAVETGAIRDERNRWITVSDNPYRNT